MLSIGWGEIFLCVVIAVVFINPKDMPHVLRRAGKFWAQGRTVISRLRHEFDMTLTQAECQSRVLDKDPTEYADPLKDIRHPLMERSPSHDSFEPKTSLPNGQ